MRRARRRRKISILRYRLAVRIGGWLLREEQAELDALRSQLMRIRVLRAHSHSSMGLYDYVEGADIDRVLDGQEDE